MNPIKECGSYWWRLATHSRDLFDKTAWVLTIVFWVLSIVGLATADTALKIILLIVAFAFTLRTVFWLPFKEQKTKDDELNRIKTEVTGRLIIHSAHYFHGEKSEDVTLVIRKKIVEGFLAVNVDNDLTQSDPKPNSVKTLRLDYSFQNKREIVSIEERQPLVLPGVQSFGVRGFGRFEVF